MKTAASYDGRQYRLMLDKLNAYQHKQSDLGSLIGDLAALCDALEDVQSTWRDEFWQHLGTMEIVYSIALDEGRSQLDPPDQSAVDEAVLKLRNMIQRVR